MIELDLMREAFDSTMLAVMKDHFGEKGFEWTGINYAKELNQSLPHVISAFNPGRVVSQELGDNHAAAIRDGVYIVTLSLPPKKSVDILWQAAVKLENAFRRKYINKAVCPVWCDEPYTENRGTDPDDGRYLISTTIPWSVCY